MHTDGHKKFTSQNYLYAKVRAELVLKKMESTAFNKVKRSFKLESKTLINYVTILQVLY